MSGDASRCEHGCDCPATSFYVSASDVGANATATCAALSRRTILFAGDSLMRGLGTTAPLSLLKADDFDAQAIAGERACMICARKYLEPLGVHQTLLDRGLLHERLNSAESAHSMLACIQTGWPIACSRASKQD